MSPRSRDPNGAAAPEMEMEAIGSEVHHLRRDHTEHKLTVAQHFARVEAIIERLSEHVTELRLTVHHQTRVFGWLATAAGALVVAAIGGAAALLSRR